MKRLTTACNMKRTIILTSVALAITVCAAPQEHGPRHPVTIPKGIVATTPEQKNLLAGVTNLPSHATRAEVRQVLGDPTSTNEAQWVYFLTEDRVQGGYYIGVMTIFTSNRLNKVNIGFGHETRQLKDGE
jgi:hypothetical protein